MGAKIIGGAFGAILLSLAGNCLAAEPEPVDDHTSILQRTLYKALSYQAFSTIDDFVFGYIVSGTIASGGMLALANVASELGLNYAHDLTWEFVSRGAGLSEADTRTTRTATYTFVNTFRVFGLGMLLTGNIPLSIGYVAFNGAADSVVYWANDLIWGTVWPPPSPTAAPSAQ